LPGVGRYFYRQSLNLAMLPACGVVGVHSKTHALITL
jgi:hypothetical protein